MRQTTVAAALLAVTALTGCPTIQASTSQIGNNPSTVPSAVPLAGQGVVGALKSLGIAGAKSIYLATGKSSATSGYRTMAVDLATGSIVRVEADGTTEGVQASDASGSAVAIAPNYLVSPDPAFVYASLAGQGSFLVRKADGKVAKIDDAAMTGGVAGTITDSPVQSDAHGDYFYSFAGRLVKVQTQLAPAAYRVSSVFPGFRVQDAIDSVVKTFLSGDAEVAQPNLSVDRDGNVLLGFTSSAAKGPVARRLYTAAGTVVSLGTLPYNMVKLSNWTGYDGKLYTCVPVNGEDGIHRIDVSADGAAAPVLIPFAPGNPTMGENGMPVPPAGAMTYPAYKATMADRDVFADSSVVYSLKDGVTTAAAITGVTMISALKASATLAYVSGVTAGGLAVVESVDPSTHAEKVVFSGAGYQLLTWTVSDGDKVTVSALRLSDNAYVVGEVKADGSLNALTTDGRQASMMVPLQ